MKKLISLLLVLIMGLSLIACGKKDAKTAIEPTTTPTPTTTIANPTSTEDAGPYAGYDVSNPVTIEMYVLGDAPVDLDVVLEEVNTKYLQPTLNSTLKVNFLSWADWTTKYPLVLAGGDPVDLMFTSSWAFYPQESSKGAFRELTMDWIEQWMPQTFVSQVPASWDQISLDGKIFAVPRNAAGLEYKNLVMVRGDLREKYGLPEISSWDTFKQYLYTIAEKDTTEAYAAAGAANEMFYLWKANKMAMEVANGFDFQFIHNNSNAAPKPEDIYYWPTSDMYKEFVLEMADFAKHNVWSKNAINNSVALQDSFVQGTSASLIWNNNMFKYGKMLEDSGIGTYEAYDVTPNVNFTRSPYSGDAMAIASNSKNPERAALVLDYIKNEPALNLLMIGGIEGKHYTLNEAGLRAAGPDAANYNFDAYGWAFRTETIPKASDLDPREVAFTESVQDNIFATPIDGFTFNAVPVQTELALLNSLVGEYNSAFQLGLFGDDTEATIEEFRSKIKETGALEVVQAELLKQYEAYCVKKGISF